MVVDAEVAITHIEDLQGCYVTLSYDLTRTISDL
jgi:hypothetical protein